MQQSFTDRLKPFSWQLGTLCVLILSFTLSAHNVAAQTDRERRYLQRKLEGEPEPGKTISDRRVKLGGKSGNAAWEFPAEPELWYNSNPVTKEAIKGKAAIILFFDEECPSCAAKWREMSRMTRRYRSKPVFFMAVNSGTDPDTLDTYVQKQRVSWPLIDDADRSFEKAMKVKTISMQNVVAVRYITADGVSHEGKWSDLRATAEVALKGAAWRVDPKEIPDKLQEAWYAIEFGDFAKAAKAVNKAADKAADKSGPLQEPAKKLIAAVQKSLREDYKKAESYYAKHEYWETYKQLELVKTRYDGYELPQTLEKTLKNLGDMPEVKTEVKAMKAYAKAKNLLDRGKEELARRAFNKIVANSAGTDAAKLSQDWLKQQGYRGR